MHFMNYSWTSQAVSQCIFDYFLLEEYHQQNVLKSWWISPWRIGMLTKYLKKIEMFPPSTNKNWSISLTRVKLGIWINTKWRVHVSSWWVAGSVVVDRNIEMMLAPGIGTGFGIAAICEPQPMNLRQSVPNFTPFRKDPISYCTLLKGQHLITFPRH